MYLYDLVDNGEINLAENILYDKIDKERSLDLFKVGVDFMFILTLSQMNF